MYNNFTVQITNILQNVSYKCKISGHIEADPLLGNHTLLAYSRATGELIGAAIWMLPSQDYVLYLKEMPDEGVMLTRRHDTGIYASETYDRMSLCMEVFVHGLEYEELKIQDRSIILAAYKSSLTSYPATIEHDNLIENIPGQLVFADDLKSGVFKINNEEYSLPRSVKGSVYSELNNLIFSGESFDGIMSAHNNPAMNKDPFGDGSLLAGFPATLDGKSVTGNYHAIEFDSSRFEFGGYNYFKTNVVPFTIPIVITRAATRTVVFTIHQYNSNSLHQEVFVIPGLLYLTLYGSTLYYYSIAAGTWTSAVCTTLVSPINTVSQIAVVISSSGVDKVFYNGSYCSYTKAVGTPTIPNTDYLYFHGQRNASAAEVVIKDIMIFNRELLPLELGKLSIQFQINKSRELSEITGTKVISNKLSISGSNLTEDLKAQFPLTNGNLGNILGTSGGYSVSQGVNLFKNNVNFNGTTGFADRSKILGWWDADDVSTITIATGVSKWLDKSGNGNNFVNATTTQQPSRQTNIINGRAVVRFDGTDDNLAIPKIQNRTISIFHVQRSTDAQYLVYTDGTHWNFAVHSTDAALISPLLSNYPGYFRINGIQFAGTTRQALYNALNNQAAVVSIIGTDIYHWSVFRIGNHPSWVAAIDLGEIIILPDTPTQSVIEGIEGFLAHRWGTTTLLPVDHPYKTNPPVGNLEEIVAGSDRINCSSSDISITFYVNAVTAQCLYKKGNELNGLAIGIDSTAHVTLYVRNNNVLTSSSFTATLSLYTTYRFELKGANITLYNSFGIVIETKAHGLTIGNYIGAESIGAAYGGSPITGTSGTSGFFNGNISDLTFADSGTMEEKPVGFENSISVYLGETECPVEVVDIDLDNNKAVLWANVPEISASEDTVLTLSTEIVPTKSGVTGTVEAQKVWDDEFVGVYHMVPGSKLIDSTANHFDGDLFNIDLSNFISHGTGFSLNLNGTDEYAVIKYPILSDSQRASITAFFKSDTIADEVRLIDLALSDSQDNGQQLTLEFNASNNLTASFYDTSETLIGSVTSAALGTVNDYNVTVNYDGKDQAGSLEMLVDSVSADTDTPTGNRISDSEAKLFLGKDSYASRFFDGKLHELLISKKQRSEDFNKVIDLSLKDNLGEYALVQGTSEITFIITVPTDNIDENLTDFPLCVNFAPVPELIYPLTFSTATVKATEEAAGYAAHIAVNPASVVTGGALNNAWAPITAALPQKFLIDYGSPKIATRMLLENYHNNLSYTEAGIKDFSIYGTNSATAFNNITYADTTDLTLLGTFQARQHINLDVSDPQYFYFDNTTAYRYYVLRISTNFNVVYGIAVRRISFLASDEVDVRTELFNKCDDPTKLIFKQGATSLPVEIEQWDDVNKKCIFHVKVPTISSSANTEIKVTVGTEATALVGYTGSTAAQDVWDSNYVAVCHMSSASSPVINSKGGFNGTVIGTLSNYTDSLGGAISFNNNVANYIDFPILTNDQYNGNGGTTIEIFHRNENTSIAQVVTLGISALYDNVILGTQANPYRFIASSNGSSWTHQIQAPASRNYEWERLSVAYDNSTGTVYVNDGTLNHPFTSAAFVIGTKKLKVGVGRALESSYLGQLKQFRFSNIKRSAAWLKATYLGLVGQLNQHTVQTGAAEVPWTPADTTTALWLDASDTSTITIETGVSEWRDKSGNNRHAFQSNTTLQPTLSGDRIVFTSDRMTIPSSAINLSDNSILIVGKSSLVGDNQYTGFVCILSNPADDPEFRFGKGDSISIYYNSTYIINADYGCSLIENLYSFAFSGSIDLELFKNGTLAASSSSVGVLSPIRTFDIGYFDHLGGLQGYRNGTICEILICPNSERQKVEGYLAHKWGLDGELPSDHPYKNAAPMKEASNLVSKAIHHWKLNQIIASTESPNEIEGKVALTFAATKTLVAGRFGSGLSGGDTTLTVDAGLDIPFKSISMWIRRINIANWCVFLCKASGDRLAAIQNSASGNYLYFFNGGQANSNLVVSDTNWHHVCITEGSTNNHHYFWLDSAKSTDEILSNLAGVFRYLSRPAYAANQENAEIDNVQVYDYVLSDSEISELFLAGTEDTLMGVASSLVPAPPTHHWQFEDLALDSISNTQIGTLPQTPIIGGKFGKQTASAFSVAQSGLMLSSPIIFVSLSIWAKYTGNFSNSMNIIFGTENQPHGMYFSRDNFGNAFYFNNTATGFTIRDILDHHFVIVTNNDGTYALYVDNVLKGNFSYPDLANGVYHFGYRGDASTAYSTAHIDDIKIFNYELTVEDVNLLYNATSATDYPVREETSPGNQIFVPNTEVTAKSVIFDFADDWGGAGNYFGVRRLEFSYKGSVIPMTSGFLAYATSVFTGYAASSAFNTSGTKIGSWAGTNSWICADGNNTNQRLIIVFNVEQTFDSIIVNNLHTSGTNTDVGAKTVKITFSLEEYTNTVYSSTINGQVLFNDVINKHISADVADDQIIPIDLGGEWITPPSSESFITFTIPSGTIQQNLRNIPVMLVLSDASGISNVDLTAIFVSIREKYAKLSGTNPKYNEFGLTRNALANFDTPLLLSDIGPRYEQHGSIRFTKQTNAVIDISNNISRSLLAGTITFSVKVFLDNIHTAETNIFGVGTEFQLAYAANSARLVVRHSSTGITANTSILPGKWHHIIVLRDTVTKTLMIYHDKSISYPKTVYTNQPAISATAIYIGNANLQGRMADIKIFNRILTEKEIMDLFGDSDLIPYKDNYVTSLIKQDVPLLLGENLTDIDVQDNTDINIITTNTYKNGAPWRDQESINSLQTTSLGPWTTVSGFPRPTGSPTWMGGCVLVKGKIHYTGGYSQTDTYGRDVYSCTVNEDGTLGAWTNNVRALPYQGIYSESVLIGNFVYNLCFRTGIQYAPINADGTLGSWIDSLLAFPGYAGTGDVGFYKSRSIVYNGFIYVIAGQYNYSVQSATFRIPINQDGSIGLPIQGTSLNAGRVGHCAFLIGNKIYVLGGFGSTGTMETAIIGDDGVLSTWTSTALPSPLTSCEDLSAAVVKNRVYLFGGKINGSYVGHIYSAPITNGVLGTFAKETNELASTFGEARPVIVKNYIYLISTSSGGAVDIYRSSILGGKNDYTDDAWTSVTVMPPVTRTVYYSLSSDGLTYKVFFNSAWKSIASSNPAVHGHTGDNNPYYWDADSQEWVYSNSSIETAISNAVKYLENRMPKSVLNAITDFSSVYSSTIGKIHIATTLWSDGSTTPEVTEIKINNKNYWYSEEYDLSEYCTTVTSASVYYNFVSPNTSTNFHTGTKLYALVTDGTQWIECTNGTIPNIPVGFTTAGKKVRFRVVWDMAVWGVNSPTDIRIEVIIK